MKHSIKSPFPLAGKTASAVRNRKHGRNWFKPNFKNCVLQRKKAPNKSIKFVINQKSVSISQNKGFPEKCDFTRPKKLLPFESVSEKKRKRFLLAETRFSKNTGLRLSLKNFGLPLTIVSKKCK